MTGINRRNFIAASTVGTLAGVAATSADEKPAVVDDNQLGKTPKTRFAVNVEMWWKKLPFLERIQRVADLGFPAIEFWPWRNKEIDAVADLCSKLKIDIAQFTAWGFTPGMNDPKNHPALVKEIEESCVIAKKLNCPMMTVVGGNDQPGMTQSEMHANIITGLKRVAPIAEANNVMLILESMNIRVNHKGHCLYGSEPAINICKQVGSTHVKINWDLYHMQITEGDLCRRMQEGFASGQIGYLQLADNPGRNEPGTGEVYYNRVLQEAYKLGYRDYVGLECTPLTDEVTAARRVAATDIW